MRFQRQASLLKKHRHMLGLSQRDVSVVFGYTSAQYISNIERGLCGFPEKDLKAMAQVLRIPKEKLHRAIVNDFKENLWEVLK